MEYSVFEAADFEQIEALQPPNWGPLKPRFEEFIRSPRCNPIKLCNGKQLIGVGTSIFHEDSAWLACIVVHPDYRNQGLGRQITQKLIEPINTSKYTTIYLDATEFGYPVYQKLGFELEGWYAHHRLQGEQRAPEKQVQVQAFQAKYEQQLLELDQQYSNEDRSFLLKNYLDTAKIVVLDQQLRGFYLPDLGDGLIVAEDSVTGLSLIKERLHKFNYAVLPDEQSEAKALLEKNGLLEMRKSRRMFLGKKREWNKQLLYNRISGQLG